MDDTTSVIGLPEEERIPAILPTTFHDTSH
jgi:hypothetical protein